MNVVCLQGSPRKRGSTAAVLGWMEEDLRARGHSVEHFNVADLSMHGCIACMMCQRDPDELICSQDDDGLVLLRKLAAADAAIYATPVYCGGFTAQFKPLIDRHLAFITGMDDPAQHRSHMQGKRVALVATCGGPAGVGNTDTLSLMFERLMAFGKAEAVGELVVAGLMDPSGLTDEHRAQAVALATKLAP